MDSLTFPLLEQAFSYIYHDDLKILRLVNRTCSIEAARVLFFELHLPGCEQLYKHHPTGHERAQAVEYGRIQVTVSEALSIACYVKTLRFTPAVYFEGREHLSAPF